MSLAMSVVRRNIVANYAGTAWMACVTLVTIPLYLKLLGTEQWGLIAACITLQAAMNMLEVGLSQIVPRELAASRGVPEAMAKCMKVFALLYHFGALTGFLLMQMTADWLAREWLNIGNIPEHNAAIALRIIAFQFLFQFVSRCYIGYWMGTQQQQLANISQAGFLTLKHLIAVVALIFVAPTVEAYLYSFAAISALEWFFNRTIVWRNLREVAVPRTVPIADAVRLLKNIGYFSAAIVAGMLVSQLDRIVLSKIVDIESFGFYSVASLMGMALLQLQYPVVSAYYPAVVRAHAASEPTRPILVKMMILLLLTTVVPAGLLGGLSYTALELWTGNSMLASHAAPALSIIAFSVILNTLYAAVYLDMLAHQAYLTILLINGVAALVASISLPFLVHNFGITAGGIAWLSNNAIGLVFGTIWLFRVRIAPSFKSP